MDATKAKAKTKQRSRARRILLPLLLAPLWLAGCTARIPGLGGSAERKPAGASTATDPAAPAATAPAATASASGRILFDFQDEKGDDRGDGRYEYPTSFQGRFGFLDITRFRVEDAGDFVAMFVEFRRPIPRTRDDGSTEAKGYWLQLVDIYVDRDGKPGSGRTWALPGRNLKFDDASAWDKVVIATPGNARNLELLIRNRTSDLALVDARHDIVIPNRVYAQGYELKLMVAKTDLGGTPEPHWGWQVFAIPYEPGNLAHNQLQNTRVQKFPDEYRFGGGSDEEGDPNVLDLLAPSAEEQYRWLSDHHASPYRGATRFATVPMVRVGGRPVAPPPAASPQAQQGAPSPTPVASPDPGRSLASGAAPLPPSPPSGGFDFALGGPAPADQPGPWRAPSASVSASSAPALPGSAAGPGPWRPAETGTQAVPPTGGADFRRAPEPGARVPASGDPGPWRPAPAELEDLEGEGFSFQFDPEVRDR